MTKEHDHNKFVYDGGTKASSSATSPKRFEEWIADKHPTPLYKAYASAGWNAGWQAAIEYQAALESRVLAEREPVAWAVPQEMAGASFIACCVQGGAYTVPLFTHPTPDDASGKEKQ